MSFLWLSIVFVCFFDSSDQYCSFGKLGINWQITPLTAISLEDCTATVYVYPDANWMGQ